MITFKFNQNKAISALLYIASKLIDIEKNADIHKIFKILYFADQKHLVKYGRPIMGDHYIAMKDGPVPTRIYDIIKIIRGDSLLPNLRNFDKYFEIIGQKLIKPLQQPEMESFADSDIECLNESIEENKNLSFNALKDKSHDNAYKKAIRNDKISFNDIALVGGAKEDMLKYIKNVAENNNLSTQ
jgi:uncharacterized phage-associated protein